MHTVWLLDLAEQPPKVVGEFKLSNRETLIRIVGTLIEATLNQPHITIVQEIGSERIIEHA